VFTLANEKRRQRLQRFIKVYARMLLNGTVDFNKLGKVYNSKELIPEAKAKKILRNREVAQMVTDEIAKIYESNGITPDFILKKRLEVLNEALSNDKKDLTNANKVLESFESKLIDNKKEVSSTETQQISFVGMLETGEKAKLTGKRTVKQIKQGNGKPQNEEIIRENTSLPIENSVIIDNNSVDTSL
jgi:hypothetical protein